MDIIFRGKFIISILPGTVELLEKKRSFNQDCRRLTG